MKDLFTFYKILGYEIITFFFFFTLSFLKVLFHGLLAYNFSSTEKLTASLNHFFPRLKCVIFHPVPDYKIFF